MFILYSITLPSLVPYRQTRVYQAQGNHPRVVVVLQQHSLKSRPFFTDFKVARTSFSRARARQTSYPRGPTCKESKQKWRPSALRKVIFPTLRGNLCLPETVSPRKFLVISKYGRKVLPELNAFFSIQVRICAVIDHVSIRVRANISMFKESQSNFKSAEGAKYHFSLPLS